MTEVGGGDGRPRLLDAGQAGDATHQMYLLLEGELQLEDPKGHLLTMLGAGGFFGAAVFVYGGKQSATVRIPPNPRSAAPRDPKGNGGAS